MVMTERLLSCPGRLQRLSLWGAKAPQSNGAAGFTIEDPADCGHILDQTLVEAVVDPYEPPMPPQVKPGQALKFAESLARGQPNRMKIAGTVLENKIRELV